MIFHSLTFARSPREVLKTKGEHSQGPEGSVENLGQRFPLDLANVNE